MVPEVEGAHPHPRAAETQGLGTVFRRHQANRTHWGKLPEEELPRNQRGLSSFILIIHLGVSMAMGYPKMVGL